MLNEIAGSLGSALEFSAADLAANQNGEMSAAQRERFENARSTVERGNRLAGYMLVGLGASSIVASVVGLFVFLARGEHLLYGIGTAVVMAVSGIGVAYWGASMKPAAMPIPDRVERIDGAVHFEPSETDGWPELPRFSIDGLTFSVSLEVAAALKEGHRYRFYYVPTATPHMMGVYRSRMILSAEDG